MPINSTFSSAERQEKTALMDVSVIFSSRVYPFGVRENVCLLSDPDRAPRDEPATDPSGTSTVRLPVRVGKWAVERNRSARWARLWLWGLNAWKLGEEG